MGWGPHSSSSYSHFESLPLLVAIRSYESRYSIEPEPFVFNFFLQRHNNNKGDWLSSADSIPAVMCVGESSDSAALSTINTDCIRRQFVYRSPTFQTLWKGNKSSQYLMSLSRHRTPSTISDLQTRLRQHSLSCPMQSVINGGMGYVDFPGPALRKSATDSV